MNCSESLRSIVNGIEKDIYEAEEIFALMDMTNEDENIATINKGDFGNFFVVNEIYLTRQLILGIAKIYEKENSRYQIHSIPAALKIMTESSSKLEIFGRAALVQELEALGYEASNLNSFSDKDLINHIVNHFKKQTSESTFESAHQALRTSRDKYLAHNEAIERDAVLPKFTYDHLRELIETAKQFISVMCAVYGCNNYSISSSDRTRAARCLKRLFRTLNGKQYWEE
jgi:AbiU2